MFFLKKSAYLHPRVGKNYYSNVVHVGSYSSVFSQKYLDEGQLIISDKRISCLWIYRLKITVNEKAYFWNSCSIICPYIAGLNGISEPKEMITPLLRKALTKQGCTTVVTYSSWLGILYR